MLFRSAVNIFKSAAFGALYAAANLQSSSTFHQQRLLKISLFRLSQFSLCTKQSFLGILCLLPSLARTETNFNIKRIKHQILDPLFSFEMCSNPCEYSRLIMIRIKLLAFYFQSLECYSCCLTHDHM